MNEQKGEDMKEYVITTVCVGDVNADTPMAAFETAPYPIPTEPDIFEKRRMIDGKHRATVRFSLKTDVKTATAAFTDGTPWYIEVTTVREDDDGQTESSAKRYDKTSYCIAGDVVEHRNGCVTIYMAEMTEEEKEIASLEEENARLLYENLTGEEIA